MHAQLILEHLKEMFSVIYTPTEGDAIANYSRLFRRPEGCYLNVEDADRVEDDINQFGGADDVDLIVVSDGEQILGIGDQGVGAILISVAKLVIYTLCAGIHPSRTLPVVLDCGTNVRDPCRLGSTSRADHSRRTRNSSMMTSTWAYARGACEVKSTMHSSTSLFRRLGSATRKLTFISRTLA
jgi:malic enzyme